MINKSLMGDFSRGIIEVSKRIEEESPDLIIYPIRGAVPIADLLRIVNPSISRYDQEYMPASSSISDTDEVIREWTANMFRHYHSPGEDLKVLSIDEVVSGHSLSRVSRGMKNARFQYRRNEGLSRDDGDLAIKHVGIVDTRYKKEGKPYQKGYSQLVDMGLVIPVEVNENLVMDNPTLCPLVLKRNEGDMPHFLPVMETYQITPEYLNFLKEFSVTVGQDLSTVNLQNPEKIRNSERFLPPRYRG